MNHQTSDHSAKALILHCMDYRFVHDILHEMKRRGLDRQYDDIGLAGAALNLVAPLAPYDREAVLQQIELAKKLHGITDVFLFNHLDCGAYGKIFSTPEEEHTRHVDDLHQAKSLIESQFGLAVHSLIARLDHDHQVHFEEV